MLPPPRTLHDVAIIGSGPVGLFAVFELGLVGLQAALIDILPHAGGQCAALYPHKPIYDIPGIPSCTGAELTENLKTQIRPFSPSWFLGKRVSHVQHRLHADDPPWTLLDDHQQPITQAKALVLATGAGVFSPKTLGVPGEAPCLGHSVFTQTPPLATLHNQQIVIAGGGDSAMDWALVLLEAGISVTIVHRRPTLRATPANVTRWNHHVDNGTARLIVGQIRELQHDHGQVHHLRIDTAGDMMRLPATTVLVFFGQTITTGPLVRALDLANNAGLIEVATDSFASSTPGVWAIGDANTYAGKLKLILSGFHEAALMARSVYAHLHDGIQPRFEYTTTSRRLLSKLEERADKRE